MSTRKHERLIDYKKKIKAIPNTIMSIPVVRTARIDFFNPIHVTVSGVANGNSTSANPKRLMMTPTA